MGCYLIKDAYERIKTLTKQRRKREDEMIEPQVGDWVEYWDEEAQRKIIAEVVECVPNTFLGHPDFKGELKTTLGSTFKRKVLQCRSRNGG